MRHTYLLKHRAFSSLGVIAGCAVAGVASILMAQSSGGGPGGGNPSCFSGLPLPACDFYIDATPECPDLELGGGTCGWRYSSSGLDRVVPAGVTCLVEVKGPDASGNCISYGTHNMPVSCKVPAGGSCS